MAVRLSGVFDPERREEAAAPAEREWEERYPALPPWRRVVRRFLCLTIVLDVSGDSALSDGLRTEEDGRLGVAGAIRLDRRSELIQALGVEGPSVEGDTGLILAAYRRWGADAFARLEGDFAFVLWDLRTDTVHLVRDPFGVRRMHYASPGAALVFATDVEGVLAWPQVERTPDDVTILAYLLGRYADNERTFFRGVKRVRRRHVLRVRRRDRRLEPTREPVRGPGAFSTLDEYAHAFRTALQRSVDERLPATGGAVCHVSGGLDSASVASLAASRNTSASGGKISLASARFPGLACDEGGAIHELGRWLGIPIREWNGLDPETSELTDGRLAWPLGRSSSGGSRQGDLDLATAEGAGVLLTGFGGNQIAFEDGFLRDALATRGWTGYVHGLLRIARNRPWTGGPRYLRRTAAVAKNVAKQALFGPPVSARRRPVAPAWVHARLADALSVVDAEAEVPLPEEPRTGSWMTDAVWAAAAEDPNDVWALEQMDARACERGLEFRHPYLCWDLLTVAMAIPWWLRAPTAVDRPLQRLALRGVLPERLRCRDTYADFTPAFLANTIAARSLIEDLLTAGPWASDQFVDRRAAVDELRRLMASSPPPGEATVAVSDAWQALRDIAALEAWLRRV